MSKCKINQCNSQVACKEVCNRHYLQIRKYGHVQTKADMAARYATRPKSRYWLGKKMRDSTVEAIKRANTGRRAWNKVGDGITPTDKLERTKFRKIMQMNIFKRDNFTCQFCDQYGGYLQIDHIKGWAEYPELRFEPSNCRTLCMACHYYITFKRKLPQGVIWGHNLSRRIAS